MATKARAGGTRRFLVVGGVSTRVKPDVTCDDWLAWNDGDEVDEAAFPAHVPVAEWIASGHLIVKEGAGDG